VGTSLGSFVFLWCMFVLGVMYVIKVMGNEMHVGSCGPLPSLSDPHCAEAQAPCLSWKRERTVKSE
jgi:hypothetical protein